MWIHDDSGPADSGRSTVWDHWDEIVADLRERYGLDLTTEAGLTTPWVHVRRLIQQLLHVPPALSIAPNGGVVVVPQTRFGMAVHGIAWPTKD